MKTSQYLGKILQELNRSADDGLDEQADELISQLLASRKVFVAGAGRSGLMARAFAMRLMHLGLDAYVVGETVTPPIGKEDVLIIASGSGETKSLISMAAKANSLEASVALVTIHPESTVGQLSQVAVKLPGSPKEQSDSSLTTIQPMGSLFEQGLLLFFDALVLRLMERLGDDAKNMFGRHANLE
ncbi:6-phospho 3-hexuloisomerase [Paenibacillus ferrarius]|uniref:6-phospho 3-hexuloisomerase n=1 Tax=Paenibacillus ferrarius TaxID=1469647 RepID=A0A1V4H6G0_9BACL|nr:6-phospho-3-hexuloisomerase [Paenibacillus ferrarius]OPH46808.1 6-phospho 3-hexuloisomerase [Paenibacillus ferrarius]